MDEIFRALLFCSVISATALLFDFTSRSLPDHPMYVSYTYSFTHQEKQKIIFYSSAFKGDLKNYHWPTNLRNNKLNNFFKILNLKERSPQYYRALKYLLILNPGLIYHINKSC